MIFRFAATLAFAAIAFSQVDTGELRLTAKDSGGLPVEAQVSVSNDRLYTRGSQAGNLALRRLLRLRELFEYARQRAPPAASLRSHRISATRCVRASVMK
jgi:hypothetical protein